MEITFIKEAYMLGKAGLVGTLFILENVSHIYTQTLKSKLEVEYFHLIAQENLIQYILL